MCLFKCETCKLCAINIFLRFPTEESEISIKKDFGHVLATGYWQIPLICQITVAVHTLKSQKVKKLIHRIIMPFSSHMNQ